MRASLIQGHLFDTTLFFKQKKTWRARPEKNKSEIVIVYFYASNHPVVEKTSLQKLFAHIRRLYILYNKSGSQFFSMRDCNKIKQNKTSRFNNLAEMKTYVLLKII